MLLLLQLGPASLFIIVQVGAGLTDMGCSLVSLFFLTKIVLIYTIGPPSLPRVL